MKITYFLDWSGSPESGVPMKVIDQITEWQKQSHEVELIVLAHESYAIEWATKGAKVIPFHSKIGRLYSRLITGPLHVLKTKPDIFYSRYGIYSPLELMTILLSFSVLEINAENDSYYKMRSKIINFIYRIQKRPLQHIVDAFIHVTLDSYKRSPIASKSTFITNGINLDRYRNQIPTTNRAGNISAIFLTGGDFAWNGYKRLELIAESLNGLTIYAVGINSATSDKIVHVDPTYGEQLEIMVNQMDLGISTLDIQLMGIDEAAPLKTRHYLASGLPVIAGCKDSAFQTEVPFYFRVLFNENDTKITNIQELQEFIENCKSTKVKRDLLYNIDIRNTERQRLSFIKKILNQSQTRTYS